MVLTMDHLPCAEAIDLCPNEQRAAFVCHGLFNRPTYKIISPLDVTVVHALHVHQNKPAQVRPQQPLVQ